MKKLRLAQNGKGINKKICTELPQSPSVSPHYNRSVCTSCFTNSFFVFVLLWLFFVFVRLPWRFVIASHFGARCDAYRWQES